MPLAYRGHESTDATENTAGPRTRDRDDRGDGPYGEFDSCVRNHIECYHAVRRAPSDVFRRTPLVLDS